MSEISEKMNWSYFFYRLKDVEGMNEGTLFPRFNTKFRYSGRTQAQAKKAAEAQHRPEPHIARTAERRSLNKDKSKDDSEYWMSAPDIRQIMIKCFYIQWVFYSIYSL